jgi:hypothetical protein
VWQSYTHTGPAVWQSYTHTGPGVLSNGTETVATHKQTTRAHALTAHPQLIAKGGRPCKPSSDHITEIVDLALVLRVLPSLNNKGWVVWQFPSQVSSDSSLQLRGGRFECSWMERRKREKKEKRERDNSCFELIPGRVSVHLIFMYCSVL